MSPSNLRLKTSKHKCAKRKGERKRAKSRKNLFQAWARIVPT